MPSFSSPSQQDNPAVTCEGALLEEFAAIIRDDDLVNGPPSRTCLTALCLSGGGIRSAAFCLGALQALAEKDVLREFYEAKRAEPGFWHYDGQVAEFLLPNWYGKDGDWEKLAEAEIQRGDGLGVEEYARTVYEMSAHYQDIFKESRAGWALVKEGYGAMVQKYPDSRKLLNQFALLAVLADDVPEAHEAFRAMGGQADPSVWSGRSISDFLARARWQR